METIVNRVVVDKQGRVVIDAKFRKLAGIKEGAELEERCTLGDNGVYQISLSPVGKGT